MSELYTYDRAVARVIGTTVESTALKAVTANEAKLYARVDSSTEDSIFDILIDSGQREFERYTSKLMFERTVTSVFQSDGYALLILPYLPVASITSVQDEDGGDVDYSLKGDRIQVDAEGEITVIYECGLFDAVDDVEDGIKLGFLKYIVSNYEDRQDVSAIGVSELPNGSRNEWNRYKTYSL